jgi:hypothetical protein
MGSYVDHAHEPLLEIQPVIQDGRLRLTTPLFVAKRDERVDPGGAVCGEQCCQHRHDAEQRRDANEDRRVERCQTEQQGPARIVREENPPARPGPRDRLYYRWYAKEVEGVMRARRWP